MVLKNKFPIRILAIAGALLVLLSCVPVVPAAAAYVDLSYTGWEFDDVLDPPLWTGSLAEFLGGDVAFTLGTHSDIVYIDMYYDPVSCVLSYTMSNSVNVSAFYFNSSTWRQEDFRQIHFTDAMSNNDVFYRWLSGCASMIYDSNPDPDPDPAPGDQFVLQAGQWECKSLTMTGEYVALASWPDDLVSVPINFTSSNHSFSSMSGQYNIVYGDCLYYDSKVVYKYSDITGSASAAWQSASFAKIYFDVAQVVPKAFYDWFTVNFTRTGSDPAPSSYSTTVNIYDSTGLVLLHSIRFTASEAAPVAMLSVSKDGCTISCGDQSTSWYSGDMVFYGFKLSAGSVGPVYKSGLPYSLPGGYSSDLVIDLYVADSEGAYDDSVSVIAGFLDIFIDPVMAFFSAEFVPGYSLAKICLFSLLLGLLFWFLAVHK